MIPPAPADLGVAGVPLDLVELLGAWSFGAIVAPLFGMPLA